MVSTQASTWLQAHARENLGTPIVLDRFGGRDDTTVLVGSADGQVVGVSVVLGGGEWFLEASADALAPLCEATMQRRRPTKVTVAATLRDAVRTLLGGAGGIRREHELVVMRCEGTSARPEGRWARLEDVAGLREYQAAYNEERGTQTDRDWPAAIGRRGVAVVERAGRIASVLCRSGETRRVACIGGTYTFPDFRRCGLASRLTAFMVGDLLGEHDAVQLVVDDDNVAAIALYRGIGFETIGGCYMAYLD